MSNTWTRFWEAVGNFLSGRFSEANIRRISAAFGSFLLLGVGALVVIINFYLASWITNPVVLTSINTIIAGFVGFIGVLIVTFFGTTETLPEADKLILEKAKALLKHAQEHPDEVLSDAIAGLLSAVVNLPEEIPDVPETELEEEISDAVETIEDHLEE